MKCRPTLELAAGIIDGSNEQEEVVSFFPGDDLFTPLERRRGLPIGNQTSQFFANVYLNVLDHFVMRELRPALYLRYVDDFVLLGNDKPELTSQRRQVELLLGQLRLNLNGGKSRVYRCGDGCGGFQDCSMPGRLILRRWSGVLWLGWDMLLLAIRDAYRNNCSMSLN